MKTVGGILKANIITLERKASAGCIPVAYSVVRKAERSGGGILEAATVGSERITPGRGVFKTAGITYERVQADSRIPGSNSVVQQGKRTAGSIL